ncbi:cellulose-binding gdsl lipase [Moniliophthora roreri MCA 2997]|uniref:Cellulose-binding gdsl lipase n=2 Tax=Moniliophthora roreri TaxID=221103 RepID=V2XNY6_MONRO|nr:cellulose-binding gdsl lipase [Moniliophthora roreri MCA 2997]KAI3610503.1 cellulose-binding gdsl lipase [Moniliophthora roreri]
MSQIIQIGKDWPSFSGLRKLIIFGDSYSSVGYRGKKLPSVSKPLGVDFPGVKGTMWNEAGTSNWVGHLITQYAPEPRYSPNAAAIQDAYREKPLLVYNYAVGGDTMSGVQFQIDSCFLAGDFKKLERYNYWDPNHALFVTWIGINDCAYSHQHGDSVNWLFTLQDKLYRQAEARHFMFIDVPPIHRSPAVRKGSEESASRSNRNWNETLQSAASSFAEAHSDATVLLYSSASLFNRVLDDPSSYGFDAEDTQTPFSKFWNDNLHPTSKVHEVLAEDIALFLAGIRMV